MTEFVMQIGEGSVSVTVYKRTLLADGTVTEQPHRITFHPTDNVAQILAENNAHLQAMGYPPIDSAEIQAAVAEALAK